MRTLALLILLALLVQGQERKRELKPGEQASLIISTSGTVTTATVTTALYSYAPKADITTYELALLLPLFAGPSYGLGRFHTGGSIVPMGDPKPGCSTNDPAFTLAEYNIQRLGTAVRHLRACRWN